jgi:glycerol-3-phosphate dehydrogenase (NAD(P)+)
MTSALGKVAVLGAGNWGTTIAHLIGRNGHDTTVWTQSAELAREITESHANSAYTPGLRIAEGVRATTALDEALADAALVFIVVPSQAFREVCRKADEVLKPDQIVIHATKGLEATSHRRMSEILVEETCVRQFGVLSGPNIAPEIAAGKPAGTTIASHIPRVVDLGRKAIGSERLMVFHGDDVIGTELAGAFKNVVAIAAGAADGLKVGENAKAFLISRGMTEMIRLAVALGAQPQTFVGIVGIGDLVVTCASAHSRNHRVGQALARGEDLKSILANLHMVAEGVHAAKAAHELAAARGVHVPLMEHVYQVLYEGLSPQVALSLLMQKPAGRDAAVPAR